MKDLKIIKEILSKHYDLEKNPTYLFGSRVNNTHRPNSDLDIFIDDSTILPETVAYLEEEFEESSLSYKIDIVLRSRIDDTFYAKIKNALKEIV